MGLLDWRNCKLYNVLLCGVLSIIKRFMDVIVYIESTLKLGAERRACGLFHSFTPNISPSPEPSQLLRRLDATQKPS